MDEPPLPHATPCDGGGGAPAATPTTAEASHYLQVMGLSEKAVLFTVVVMEDDGACTSLYVSSGVTQLLGYPPEEYLALGPMQLQEAIHPADVGRVARDMAESRAECVKTWRTVRYRAARKDASWADIESVYTTRGRLYYGIMRDGSGATATQRMLKELLLSTSYDLRCSATSIVSAASLLRSRACVTADAEAAFLADAVRSSCDLLSGLAANVLELRRLERGELRVTCVPFCVHATLRAVIQMCAMAKCAGAELAWEDEARAAEQLPPCIEGDPTLIGLVVQNLCTNALKFCNGSRVRVRVTMEPPAPQLQLTQQHEAAVLGVDVEDHGVGVAPGDCERIFHKYERAPQDKGGGAGLGLHISRGFARAMGGDVSLRSALGVGSTFTLRVPVRVLDADEAAAAAAAVSAGGSGLDAQAWAGEQEVPAPNLAERLRDNQAARQHPATVDPFAEVSLDEMLLQLLSETSEIFMYTFPLRRETMSRIAYISPSVRGMLGWEPSQLIGQRSTYFLHPDDVQKHAAATAAMWSRDAPAAAAVSFGMRRFRRADGGYAWMHLEVARVGDTYYALLRDASRGKDSQRSLKEYLLATSHDMRTPVTGIIAAAELLEARPGVRADAEAAFLVQSIKSCGQMMESTIANVMELRALGDEAEGSSSPRVLRPSPFDPRALAADVLAGMCSAMRGDPDCAHVINISCASAPLPACVVADAARVRSVLQNVFSSMLRHATDDRQLSIKLACVPRASAADAQSPDALAELQLEACDAARHVADAAELELMFTPYHSSRTPDAGGAPAQSSLGLCVAQEFVRAMGGTLLAERATSADAPPPSGLVFRMRLPVRVPAEGEAGAATPVAPLRLSPLKRAYPGDDTPKPQTPPTPQAAEWPQQKHILLAEDHELILRLISKLLRAAGFRVSTAANGAEALAALQAAHAAGAPLPDAVLTDVQMPVMDGLAFTRAFRAWETSRLAPGQARLPIIALSANVLDEHIAAAYAAGVTRHFAKPLRAEAVQELRRMLRCAEPPPSPAGDTPMLRA